MNTDSEFQSLLADYAAPVEDNGFSDAVLAKAAARERREARLSRWRLWLTAGALSGSALTVALVIGPLLPTEPTGWLEASLQGLAAAAVQPATIAAVALLPLGWLLLDPDAA